MDLPESFAGMSFPFRPLSSLLQPSPAFLPPAVSGLCPGDISFFRRSSFFKPSLWGAFASRNGFEPSSYSLGLKIPELRGP
jgi:hypothetical protein